MDREPQPVPVPVANAVVHIGDTLFPDRLLDGRYEYRLFDADRRHYATLAGHHDDDGRFVVDAIQYLGGKLLPVRAQPDAPAVARPLTLSVSISNLGAPAVFTLTHSHAHRHAHRPPDDADGAYAHAHAHPHAGADAARAGTFGHASDPHDHDH